MTAQSELRRYLVNIDTASTHQLFTDCLVVGAGIAGLRAAIEAAVKRNVIIVCKDSLENSNSWRAQGGIASVLHKTDSFESHVADTLNTGCGLSDKNVVDLVVRQGPELIYQLLEWGAEFDKDDGQIATTLEGGHSQPRVAHAHGDETGRAIVEALIDKVRREPKIKVMEYFFAIDLLTNDDNECVGIIGRDKRGTQIIWAANTILTTGGAGQLYRETTNPEIATGDGRSRPAGPRTHAVPPNHPLHCRRIEGLDNRSSPRRRSHPARQHPQGVYERLPRSRRTRPP